MRHARTTFIALLLLISPIIANAEPTAASLIRRHVDAVGGLDAFKDVTSVHRCGTIEFFETGPGPVGIFTYETVLQLPDLLVERLARPGQMLVHRGLDGDIPWDGVQPIDPAAREEVTARMRDTVLSANRDGLSLDAVADGAAIALRPSGVPETSTCVDVPEIPEIPVHCYDLDTGLLSHLSRHASLRTLSDWRKVEDVMIPFSVSQRENGRDVYAVTLEKVETNLATATVTADRMRAATDPNGRATCSE